MTLCLIDNVAFGGEGVARVDGLAVFIPFTLPGEKVEIKIEKKKKNFAKASLQKLVEKSPERVTPLCPYFGTCGGCDLQHAAYPLQLKIKKKFIEDSLIRIGHIHFNVPSVQPSSESFAYRRHITLKIKKDHNKWSLGFSALDGSHLPVRLCFLLHSQDDPIISLLQDIFSQLNPDLFLSDSSIKVLKHLPNQYLIACNFLDSLPKNDIDLLNSRFKASSSISGWIIKTPTETSEHGNTKPYFMHDSMKIHYSPFGFVQNHPEQSEKIYNWILEKNKLSQRILDLYCGVGASSLLLAGQNKEVLGIELNPFSIELALQNREENHVKGVEFICASAESASQEALSSFKPDAIVINPPKTGIDPDVLKSVVESSTKSITYISCSPPTLARDLAFLTKNGFVLQDLLSFDMFPQTTHVETVVYLIR